MPEASMSSSGSDFAYGNGPYRKPESCPTALVRSAAWPPSGSTTAAGAPASGWPIQARFFTERATAEADLEGIDQDQWETRIVDILRDEEPDYRARLQLEGRSESSPWPATGPRRSVDSS
jgi:hypothetical protein